MKKPILFFLMAVASASMLLLQPSCDKVKDLAKFDVKMDLPAQNFNIEKPAAKAGLASVDQYYDFSVSVNLDSIQEKHNLSSFGVENGKITKALVSITAPAGANLAFLISARLVLFNESNQEMQVAHTGTISPDATQVELILDAQDIASLIKMKNFNGRLYYTFDPELMPAQTVAMQLVETVQFTVTPL